MPELEAIAEREAARRKSELVATLSHELRTPLASVLGFVELLLHRELDEHTRRRYLLTIHGEANRLAALIDDFLDLERMESGRFTLALEPFDLRPLLQHEVDIFSAQSASHTLELLAPDEPLAIIGDRTRMGQVVANLLSNAIKYSPAGGAVTVSATPGDGFARVQVCDTGVGIPVAQQAQVFTKFFRVDSSDTRDIGGTGLGLSLCQEIVTAHGGRIGFKSTEGGGSTFWFEMPSAWSAGVSRRTPRVLVIADDSEFATRFSTSLAADGIEAEITTTGVRGLERTLALPPSVICLDIDVPGDLDGWQILVRLKANPVTAHIPVVVCSEEAGRTTAATIGAAGFVIKPFSLAEVREAVSQQLPDKRSCVLVVGGDQTLRRLVVETLARDGGDLREAADALEALAMIAIRRPDALVFDLAAAGNDGFAMIERLLDRPETLGLPVVVLTGRDLTPEERSFLVARNASLLEKRAYSGDRLRQIIRHARIPASKFALLVGHGAAMDSPGRDSATLAPVRARDDDLHPLAAGHHEPSGNEDA